MTLAKAKRSISLNSSRVEGALNSVALNPLFEVLAGAPRSPESAARRDVAPGSGGKAAAYGKPAADLTAWTADVAAAAAAAVTAAPAPAAAAVAVYAAAKADAEGEADDEREEKAGDSEVGKARGKEGAEKGGGGSMAQVTAQPGSGENESAKEGEVVFENSQKPAKGEAEEEGSTDKDTENENENQAGGEHGSKGQALTWRRLLTLMQVMRGSSTRGSSWSRAGGVLRALCAVVLSAALFLSAHRPLSALSPTLSFLEPAEQVWKTYLSAVPGAWFGNGEGEAGSRLGITLGNGWKAVAGRTSVLWEASEPQPMGAFQGMSWAASVGGKTGGEKEEADLNTNDISASHGHPQICDGVSQIRDSDLASAEEEEKEEGGFDSPDSTGTSSDLVVQQQQEEEEETVVVAVTTGEEAGMVTEKQAVLVTQQAWDERVEKHEGAAAAVVVSTGVDGKEGGEEIALTAGGSGAVTACDAADVEDADVEDADVEDADASPEGRVADIAEPAAGDCSSASAAVCPADAAATATATAAATATATAAATAVQEAVAPAEPSATADLAAGTAAAATDVGEGRVLPGAEEAVWEVEQAEQKLEAEATATADTFVAATAATATAGETEGTSLPEAEEMAWALEEAEQQSLADQQQQMLVAAAVVVAVAAAAAVTATALLRSSRASAAATAAAAAAPHPAASHGLSARAGSQAMSLGGSHGGSQLQGPAPSASAGERRQSFSGQSWGAAAPASGAAGAAASAGGAVSGGGAAAAASGGGNVGFMHPQQQQQYHQQQQHQAWQAPAMSGAGGVDAGWTLSEGARLGRTAGPGFSSGHAAAATAAAARPAGSAISGQRLGNQGMDSVCESTSNYYGPMGIRGGGGGGRQQQQQREQVLQAQQQQWDQMKMGWQAGGTGGSVGGSMGGGMGGGMGGAGGHSPVGMAQMVAVGDVLVAVGGDGEGEGGAQGGTGSPGGYGRYNAFKPVVRAR
ncbi:unnamed protein product, partial [Closterium sp. NIES-64]